MPRSTLLPVLILAAAVRLGAQDTAGVALTLSKEDIAAALSEETFSLPMPGEFFAALAKCARPDWAALQRKSPTASFTSRQQIALNLGALVADGYIAVEAEEAQQVKNLAKDIKSLAKGLGIGQELVNRGNSIVEYAQDKRWDVLKEELEAAQNEVVAVMNTHKDQSLVTLVLLGGWLRGTEAVAGHLAGHYTPEGARLLRQPAVVNYFVQKLARMDKELVDTPLMTELRLQLFELRKAASFPHGSTPSREDAVRIHSIAAALVKRIATKE